MRKFVLASSVLFLAVGAQAQLSVIALGPNSDPDQAARFKVAFEPQAPAAHLGTFTLVIQASLAPGETQGRTPVPLASVNGQDCVQSGPECFMLGQTDARPDGHYFYYGVALTPDQSVEVSFLPWELCYAAHLQGDGEMPDGCGFSSEGYAPNGPIAIRVSVFLAVDPTQPLNSDAPLDASDEIMLPFSHL